MSDGVPVTGSGGGSFEAPVASAPPPAHTSPFPPPPGTLPPPPAPPVTPRPGDGSSPPLPPPPGGGGGGGSDGRSDGGDGDDADPSGSRRRGTVIAVVVAIALLVAGAIAAVFVLGDDGDDEITTATTDGTEATDSSATTEPPSATAPPTASSVASPGASSSVPTTDAVATTTATTQAPATTTPSTTEPATTAPPTSPVTTATATTEPVTGPTTTAPTGPGPAPACAYLGIDTFDDMQVELAFTNPVADDGPLEVEYALADGSGTTLVSSVEFVGHTLVSERFRIEVDTLETRPGGVDDDDITCEIVSVDVGLAAGDAVPAGDLDTCSFVEVDSFDDIQVEITIANPFDQTVEPWALVALYGDGVRFGDTTAIFGPLAPGETATVDDDTLTSFPAWADESSFSCAVLTIESF